MGKLDQLLTWLWRVHGVDYYAGTEVAEPDAEQRAGPRPTLRCPRPEDGEQVSETRRGPVKRQAACERHQLGSRVMLQSDVLRCEVVKARSRLLV